MDINTELWLFNQYKFWAVIGQLPAASPDLDTAMQAELTWDKSVMVMSLAILSLADCYLERVEEWTSQEVCDVVGPLLHVFVFDHELIDQEAEASCHCYHSSLTQSPGHKTWPEAEDTILLEITRLALIGQ